MGNICSSCSKPSNDIDVKELGNIAIKVDHRVSKSYVAQPDLQQDQSNEIVSFPDLKTNTFEITETCVDHQEVPTIAQKSYQHNNKPVSSTPSVEEVLVSRLDSLSTGDRCAVVVDERRNNSEIVSHSAPSTDSGVDQSIASAEKVINSFSNRDETGIILTSDDCSGSVNNTVEGSPLEELLETLVIPVGITYPEKEESTPFEITEELIIVPAVAGEVQLVKKDEVLTDEHKTQSLTMEDELSPQSEKNVEDACNVETAAVEEISSEHGTSDASGGNANPVNDGLDPPPEHKDSGTAVTTPVAATFVSPSFVIQSETSSAGAGSRDDSPVKSASDQIGDTKDIAMDLKSINSSTAKTFEDTPTSKAGISVTSVKNADSVEPSQSVRKVIESETEASGDTDNLIITVQVDRDNDQDDGGDTAGGSVSDAISSLTRARKRRQRRLMKQKIRHGATGEVSSENDDAPSLKQPVQKNVELSATAPATSSVINSTGRFQNLSAVAGWRHCSNSELWQCFAGYLSWRLCQSSPSHRTYSGKSPLHFLTSKLFQKHGGMNQTNELKTLVLEGNEYGRAVVQTYLLAAKILSDENLHISSTASSVATTLKSMVAAQIMQEGLSLALEMLLVAGDGNVVDAPLHNMYLQHHGLREAEVEDKELLHNVYVSSKQGYIFFSSLSHRGRSRPFEPNMGRPGSPMMLLRFIYPGGTIRKGVLDIKTAGTGFSDLETYIKRISQICLLPLVCRWVEHVSVCAKSADTSSKNGNVIRVSEDTSKGKDYPSIDEIATFAYIDA